MSDLHLHTALCRETTENQPVRKILLCLLCFDVRESRTSGAHTAVFTHHSFGNGAGIILILNCLSLVGVGVLLMFVCLVSEVCGENSHCAWSLFLGVWPSLILCRGNADFSCLGVSVTFDKLMAELS